MPLPSLESRTHPTRAPGITRPLAELKPPLKWAGSKRWLVPYLRNLWERHSDRRLVEPVVGGLAVSLGLQPQSAKCHDKEVAERARLRLPEEIYFLGDSGF